MQNAKEGEPAKKQRGIGDFDSSRKHFKSPGGGGGRWTVSEGKKFTAAMSSPLSDYFDSAFHLLSSRNKIYEFAGQIDFFLSYFLQYQSL